MAIAKSYSNIVTPGTSLASGVSSLNNVQSAASGYDVSVGVSITTGSSAPTTSSNATVYASYDGTNWFQVGFLPGSVTVSQANSAMFQCPAGVQDVRVDFSAPSGAAQTIAATLGLITSL